ncbi:MAG: autotransporter-associated beta strand repeat-containing protein [Planctomycetes bacterium]|nr:autotransporter-associated beta strand repeat-containing protein [Planctomycetota bacterium]
MRYHAIAMRVAAAALLACTALLAAIGETAAVTDTWEAAASGNFSDGTKWTDGSAPGAADAAAFNVGGAYTVTFLGPVGNQQLDVLSGNVTFQSSGGPWTYSLNTSGSWPANLTGATLNLGSPGAPLHLTVGSTLSVESGSTLNIKYGSHANASQLWAGTNGGGGTNTVLVDGAGSSLGAASPSYAGYNGSRGDLVFQNGAGGNLAGALNLAIFGAGSQGNLTVQSDADVILSDLWAATGGDAGQAATITVTGAGSSLTQTGASTLTLGHATTGTATLNILSGGTFTAGTGGITVNKTGLVDVSGGTLNAKGAILVDGGQLKRQGGDFNWDSGYTMTLQSGGKVDLAGSYTTPAGGAINLTGIGSRLQATSPAHDSTLWAYLPQIDVADNATLATDFLILGWGAGSAPNATLTVHGAGAALNVLGDFPTYTNAIGGGGSAGTLTVKDGAAASFTGPLYVGSGVPGDSPGSGALNVQTAAQVNTGDLGIAHVTDANDSGTVTVSGLGSQITQSGASTLVVGAASGAAGRLDIQNEGAFTTGTGQTTVAKTGTVEVGDAVTPATLNVKGDLEVAGGVVHAPHPWGGLNWDPNRTLTIRDGGRVTLGASFLLPTGAAVNVSGTDSKLETQGSGALQIAGGSSVTVTDGGAISAAWYLDVGTTGNGTLVVDGGTATAATGASYWGAAGATASLTFRNGAAGNFAGSTYIVFDGTGTTATVNVESGAGLSVDDVLINNTGGTGTAGMVTVTGAGSIITHAAGCNLTVGQESSGTAYLEISIGASYVVQDDGTTYLNKTGVIDINGGSAYLGNLVHNGGVIYLQRGYLDFIGNYYVGVGGVMGPDVYLTSAQRMYVNGDTTVGEFGSLTLDGGTFWTDGFNPSAGTFRFASGLFGVGANGLGTFDLISLGSTFTVGPDCYFIAANTAVLGPGQRLTVNGGHFQAFVLDNAGQISVDSGGLLDIPTTSTNRDPGSIAIGKNASAYVGGAMSNLGEILLDGGTAAVGGPGTIANTGLIRGDGKIANPVTNAAAGEIRAEAGKRLKFDGALGSNDGLISLQGGTLEFTQALTNDTTGAIMGRGTLIVGGTGLANNGSVGFSGGFTDVYGDLANNAGAKAVISGGGTATFYDDVVIDAASQFKVSEGCAAVFFGSLSGEFNISGTGTVYNEGDLRPGLSPAAVSFGGNLVFGGASSVEIEVAGMTPGAEHDQLNVAAQATLDGTMNVVLIDPYRPAHNDAFAVITYGSRNGTFDTINGLDLGSRLTLIPAYAASDLTLMAVQGGPGAWRYDQDGSAAASTNWTAGLPNGIGDAATLGAVITTSRTVTLDAPTVWGGMTFDSTSNYGVQGPATLTLQNSGSAAAGVTVAHSGAGNGHNVSANVTLASPLDVNVASGAAITFSGAIGNTGGQPVAKSGEGTLVLSGANAYGGGTTVSDGTLLVNNTAGSGTGSGAVTVGAATLGGTGIISGPVILTGDSTLTSTGTLTLINTLTISGDANQLPSGTVLTGGNVTIDPGAVFIINGTLGGAGTLIVRGTLMGKGTIGKAVSIEAGGTFSPGAPSTILTLGQVIVAEVPQNFSFEIGAPGPDYTNPANSVNDVLRLTSATLPFANAAGDAPASLTTDTVIDVYFLFSEPAIGEYKAEFFAGTDYSEAVADATLRYWRLDPRGERLHNGNFFSPLDGSLVDWSVVPETAVFGGVETGGYITAFTVVPEPATLALVVLGGVALAARRKKN